MKKDKNGVKLFLFTEFMLISFTFNYKGIFRFR